MTSYVIARTLGDPTASTSHKSSFATQLPPKSDSKITNPADSIGTPTVLADPDPDPIDIPVTVLSPEDESPPSGISTKPSTTSASTAAAVAPPGSGATSSRAFFVDGEEGSEDDGAARLAGVGVFSPVASMPGSPTVSRRNFFERDGEDDAGGGGSGSSVASGTDESGSPFVALRGVLLRSSGSGGAGGFTIHHHHQHHQGGREAETEQEHEHEHEHSRSLSDGGSGGPGGANGGGSTSGESSFAILDREESFEDAGVHIRRRVPGAPADE